MTPTTPVAEPEGVRPPPAGTQDGSGGLRPPLARSDDAPIPLIDPADLPRPPADPALAVALERAERIAGGDIRPYDYLPVTPAVTRAVERDLAFARDRCGGEVSAEVARRQLHQRLLSFHHGLGTVCYVEDDRGVIVLTAALHHVGPVLRAVAGRLPDPPAVATPDEFI